MPNLIEIIKKTAMQAVEDAKPVAVMFGVVQQTSPLAIRVEQRLTLQEGHLLLTEAVTDPPLAVGDKVILLRMQGGQKFVVLDRLR